MSLLLLSDIFQERHVSGFLLFFFQSAFVSMCFVYCGDGDGDGEPV